MIEGDDGDVELCYDSDGKVDRSKWPHETLQIISRPFAHRLANALDEANALALESVAARRAVSAARLRPEELHPSVDERRLPS